MSYMNDLWNDHMNANRSTVAFEDDDAFVEGVERLAATLTALNSRLDWRIIEISCGDAVLEAQAGPVKFGFYLLCYDLHGTLEASVNGKVFYTCDDVDEDFYLEALEEARAAYRTAIK